MRNWHQQVTTSGYQMFSFINDISTLFIQAVEIKSVIVNNDIFM